MRPDFLLTRPRPHSLTMPIQNIVLLPTSMSYLRIQSSLPSRPILNTERHAGTVRTVAPSLTASGMMCAATRMRPLGSIWKVRQRMPRVSTCWIGVGSLAGGRGDRKDGERVLSADEHLLAFELGGRVRAIDSIHEPAVRVHMHGACGLSRSNLARFSQGVLLEHDLS
jgi:hypothetical protein